MKHGRESILYKGKKYYLQQGYFVRTERLHQRIWEDSYGQIPEGMVIHHINGDSKDNRVENLKCMTVYDHHSLHFNTEKQIAFLHSQREKAAEAHRRPESRERVSRQMKKMWESVPFNKYICTICGKEYLSKNKARPKYCSQVCRGKAGYIKFKQKVSCAICKQEFETSKGKRAAVLCVKCRAIARWQKIHSEQGAKSDVISTTK